VAFGIIGIGLCRLLPEFDGPVRVALAVTLIGSRLLGVSDDVAFRCIWADGGRACRRRQALRPPRGLRDVCTRWS